MHFHNEIVIPPTKHLSVEPVVKEVMARFDETSEDVPEWEQKHTFWDYFLIGGRFSGSKLTSGIPKEDMDEFIKLLQHHNITVSNFQAGKQNIEPRYQVPMVNALWQEKFPGKGSVCPIFKSDEKYNSDICTVENIKDGLKCYRVIIGTFNAKKNKYEASWMIEENMFNGLCLIKSDWDTTVKHALKKYHDYLHQYDRVPQPHMLVQDDWLVVTVDNHV